LIRGSGRISGHYPRQGTMKILKRIVAITLPVLNRSKNNGFLYIVGKPM
jgi:hypothetical protein